MVSALAFQARDEGSIPFTRSSAVVKYFNTFFAVASYECCR